MRYMLIVSFKMPAMSRFIARTQAVVDVVGAEHQSGAGSGFGGRDVEFDFDDMADVYRAIARVHLKWPHYRINVFDRDEEG